MPVVGAKYCGVEEAVDHQRSGYLVDGDNPEEILAGVEYCLSNKEPLQKGAAAWVKAHNWSKIVGHYIQLLT
jgi:phosphatidylinositol alpha-1,6-mannosyltransferase